MDQEENCKSNKYFYVHPLGGVGGGHIIFAFSAVRRPTWFPVLILSLPNLACRFIGLIACMGLLLVMMAL